jgi:hypothetical protein
MKVHFGRKSSIPGKSRCWQLNFLYNQPQQIKNTRLGGRLSPLTSLRLLHRRDGFGCAKEVAAGRFVAVGEHGPGGVVQISGQGVHRVPDWSFFRTAVRTSPYVHSRVDSNTITRVDINPMPESTLSPSQRFWIWPLSLSPYNLSRSPGLDSQPAGPIREPYLTFRGRICKHFRSPGAPM